MSRNPSVIARDEELDEENDAAQHFDPNIPLIGTGALPSTITLRALVPLGNVVRAAWQASGLSPRDWNDLDPVERDTRITSMVEELQR
jgi:hypothetical protein